MSDASVRLHDGDADVFLKETGSTFIATTVSSCPTSYHASSAQPPALSPLQAEPETTKNHSTGRQIHGNAPVETADRCRLRRDPAHGTGECALMADDRKQRKLLEAREVNFQKN